MQDRVLIYDAECRMCAAAREGIERLGAAGEDVRFVPYQSEEAACRLGDAYRPGRPDAAFLVDGEGRVTGGLDAFLPLLPGLRGGRVLHALFRLPFARPLGRLAYRIVARNRYRWFGAVKGPPAAS
jgi:predicted DCC family thiol-disulfide oxidoreductase YuxK